jgi:hypothetical protein
VNIRIQLSRTTVKDLHHRLQQASRHDDARLVRRICLAKGLSAARPRQLAPWLQRRSPPRLAQRLAWLQFSGPLFSQDIGGWFNSESYQLKGERCAHSPA